MSAGHAPPDPKSVEHLKNTARFSVENPHITWVLLIGTIVWGLFGYFKMPQRKDPDIPAKQAMVVTPWPGASAERVEELVTRAIEQTIASNSNVSRIDSVSRGSVSTVTITLSDRLSETGQTLDDIGGRLAAIRTLPQGAGPINYVRDFGDTATLLLTVASPKADAAELALREQAIREAINKVRPPGDARRVSLLFCHPTGIDQRLLELAANQFIEYVRPRGAARDIRLLRGAGFIGIDAETGADDNAIYARLQEFMRDRFRTYVFHPDSWQPFVVRDLAQLPAKLAAVAGEKYSYRELDNFTDAMEKSLLATERTPDGPPLVAKVTRSGVLPEKVYLLYSQERLASYGLRVENLPNILQARNITVAGGQIDLSGKNVSINPSGEFHSVSEIGDVAVGATSYGAPLYLRDVVDTARDYDNPPRYLSYYRWKDDKGQWQRTRAVTLSVQMGAGQQINKFQEAVDSTLADLATRLPKDLIVARTSDQPKQVEENIELFMRSLYEAIVLVVVVSFIGFWEWRSALLMALAIPITLLMTFGMMYTLGVDLQQVSIATLIIALGLLVDDPVVAGDAIKRDLSEGWPRRIAAWLGPTKLATAIMYATVTNIVAYLPFLILPGNTGRFLYSLPVVMGCSLVASRVVSMTFIPLLGYYLLRPKREATIEERRSQGFPAKYYRFGQFLIRRRWAALLASFVVLGVGAYIGKTLKQQFFPKDLSYLAYINIALPEDASFESSNRTALEVEAITQKLSEERKRPLQSMNAFVGGGAPRFWYSLAPEPTHPNFAQIVLLFKDKHDTSALLDELQARLSREVAGARIDVRQLETGDAVGLPVGVRISGGDITALREIANRVKKIFEEVPQAARIRDDWGEDRFNVELAIDSDKANLAGITNLDVAASSATGINGYSVTTLREGDKQIPVVARLRADERSGLDSVNNLYVFSNTGSQKVPLRQISRVDYSLRNEVIRRRNQFRTITVSAVPEPGYYSSEIMTAAKPKLHALEATLPPGYRLEIGGEEEKQVAGFKNLTQVLAISVVAIFVALAFQFHNAIKPFIVFAAVPYGAMGALFALWIMGSPFGFMGFLGIVSLVGVIVSHIIVLFDFIEEKRMEGEPFEQAVLDAGIMRLRPVLITVGATVIALFPLAAHGGPLWEPMCYAQIGGLMSATFITLLLVPVIYSICVLDLKIVKWESSTHE
ncbi:MAG: efflux RND transporter permease subunit [Acidobacteria bacterium]|nr:efflux RND transporter permease subunit [Acidobacteriota bacterium]